MKELTHTYEGLLSTIPPSNKNISASELQQVVSSKADAIIVLDDDPTGTQTVYDLPVLTQWSVEVIEKELREGTPLFYILTNSRSLPEEEAISLARIIGTNIRTATKQAGKECLVLSRSDSTLRGHYPAEVWGLEKGLGIDALAQQSIHFLIPAFFEGGRFTINDVHYVKHQDQLIPAAQTPFAKDKVFGYTHSDLKAWTVEKGEGKIGPDQIHTLSLEELRTLTLKAITEKINQFNAGDICIVNAVDYEDLKIAAQCILKSNIYPLFRTAASFVAVLSGKGIRPLIQKEELALEKKRGGLMVVGSYVPKTTAQLHHLLAHPNIHALEVDVEQLLKGEVLPAREIAGEIDQWIDEGREVVLYTSRKLIHDKGNHKNLEIGKKVSDYLTDIVRELQIRPKYILAKGGITSSDVATRGLAVKRAWVLGQITAGIPVWRLGEESKFPGLSYIVFPGNVGEENGLRWMVDMLED